MRKLYHWHPVAPILTLGPSLVMLLTAAHLTPSIPCRVLYESAGAMWCLGVVLESPPPSVRAVLLAAPIRLIGKLSFSFYLLHFPILYVIGRLALSWLTPEVLIDWPLLINLTLGCVSIMVAAALALMMFYAVERPCLNLGKRLTVRTGTGTLDRATLSWPSRPRVDYVAGE